MELLRQQCVSVQQKHMNAFAPQLINQMSHILQEHHLHLCLEVINFLTVEFLASTNILFLSYYSQQNCFLSLVVIRNCFCSVDLLPYLRYSIIYFLFDFNHYCFILVFMYFLFVRPDSPFNFMLLVYPVLHIEFVVINFTNLVTIFINSTLIILSRIISMAIIIHFMAKTIAIQLVANE